MTSATEDYSTRLAATRQALRALDARGALLANLRTITFLTFFGLLLAVTFAWLPRVALVGAGASLLVFIGLAVVHAGVIHEEAKAKVRESLNHRGLERLAGRWPAFSSTGQRFVREEHLFGADLDVVGQGSLFQRLDETGTEAGEERLARWLLELDATPAQTQARQRAVQALVPLTEFRQRLVTEARLAGETKANPAKFIAWCESPSTLGRHRWAFPLAHVMVPVTLTLGVLALVGVLPSAPFVVALGLQLVVVALTRAALANTYAALMLSDQGLVRFEETFMAIDEEPLTEPLLASLKQGMRSEGPRVAERLKTFTRLLNLAALRQSGQLHPFVNALTLWDVLVLFRLDAWREKHGASVRGWFDALAQLEALSAFATLAFEEPTFVYPSLVDGPATFEAQDLRHPLLPAAVGNDVTLGAPGQALVITGSNMSGKTTLMRAIGLSTVMARAGLPVAAKRLTASALEVVTSMRVKDSLERGVSYFYAEVQRIKAVLERARGAPRQCLFLLDELFMGTNAAERQIASRHLVSTLLDLGAIGALTTHDLALCALADERPQVRNVHFRDEIRDGEMTFDYMLRNGIVQTTNALEVLRRAGVPMPPR